MLTRSARKLPGAPRKLGSSSDEGITCWFDQLSVSIHSKKETAATKILDGCSGVIREGSVVALLGPSGAGKTTLLQLLAGRLPAGGGLKVHGRLEPALSPATCAFVYQEDALCGYLTARESLLLAAELRGLIPPSEMPAAVDELLRAMGLSAVADRALGDPKAAKGKRGLSGGERKRVSIACELLGQPRALFLDEPTSGLDSEQALRVMAVLGGGGGGVGDGGQSNGDAAADDHRQGTPAAPRRRQRVTTVVSLHQPSAQLLQHCNELLLLGAGGKLLYQGAPTDLGPHLEASLGSAYDYGASLKVPLGSAFEFALSAASLDHASEAALAESEERIRALQEAWTKQVATLTTSLLAASSPNASEAGETNSARISSWQQRLRRWQWLLWRSWRLAGASPGLLAMRVVANLFTALAFGAIFYRMPRTQAGIAGRKGLAMVICNYAAMTSMVKTLGVFRTETALITRERAAGLYSVGAFYSAKVVAELPLAVGLTSLLGSVTFALTHEPGSRSGGVWFVFLLGLLWQVGSALGLALGALMPSVDAALEAGKMLTMMGIIFGGLYFDESTLPSALAWLPRASPVKLAWEGLVANEFHGLVFTDAAAAAAGSGTGQKAAAGSGPRAYATGDEVLAELGLSHHGDNGPLTAAKSLAYLALMLHAIALLALHLKRPKFATPTTTATVAASARTETPTKASVVASKKSKDA